VASRGLRPKEGRRPGARRLGGPGPGTCPDRGESYQVMIYVWGSFGSDQAMYPKFRNKMSKTDPFLALECSSRQKIWPLTKWIGSSPLICFRDHLSWLRSLRPLFGLRKQRLTTVFASPHFHFPLESDNWLGPTPVPAPSSRTWLGPTPVPDYWLGPTPVPALGPTPVPAVPQFPPPQFPRWLGPTPVPASSRYSSPPSSPILG
jgi:hypothetical protein